jgi:predicted rRNA methylase YqxC with S4 and FtsJ domains
VTILNLFWYLVRKGQVNSRSEYRRFIHMEKIYLNGEPVSWDKMSSTNVKNGDVIEMDFKQWRLLTVSLED